VQTTNSEETEGKLREIFALLFQIDPGSLSDTSSPESIPAWTSLQHLNLVLALEEEFGISLTPEDATRMQNLKTVREVVGQRMTTR
jgi:acyl carrier protein